MIEQKIQKKGFTLIEVMVSTAIFVVILTVGIGALLNVTDAYNKSQDKKIIADNLNFVIEGVSRELRLGVNYYSNPALDGSTDGSVNNGNDDSIGFTAVEERGYFIYYLNGDTLYRRRFDGGSTYTEQLTDSRQISITDVQFNVVGANEPVVDGKQAFVWVFIKGEVPDGSSSMSIQTLISQRRLDA